jgi:hypothetical protein
MSGGVAILGDDRDVEGDEEEEESGGTGQAVEEDV